MLCEQVVNESQAGKHADQQNDKPGESDSVKQLFVTFERREQLVEVSQFACPQARILHQGEDCDDAADGQQAVGEKRDQNVRLQLPRCGPGRGKELCRRNGSGAGPEQQHGAREPSQ
jgi:hypothetical protein